MRSLPSAPMDLKKSCAVFILLTSRRRDRAVTERKRKPVPRESSINSVDDDGLEGFYLKRLRLISFPCEREARARIAHRNGCSYGLIDLAFALRSSAT